VEVKPAAAAGAAGVRVADGGGEGRRLLSTDGGAADTNGDVSAMAAADADVAREQFPFIFNLLRGHAISARELAPPDNRRSKTSSQQQQLPRKPAPPPPPQPQPAVATCRQTRQPSRGTPAAAAAAGQSWRKTAVRILQLARRENMTGAGVALMRDVSILQMQGCIVHVVATFGRSRRVDVSAANSWSRGADAYAGTFSDAPGPWCVADGTDRHQTDVYDLPLYDTRPA